MYRVKTNFINQWYFKWLIIGLLLRVAIMPLTIHGDLINWSWCAHFIYQGHFDMYQYLQQNYPSIAQSADAPPLYFLFNGGWTFLLSILGLFDVNNWISALDLGNINRSVFLLKIPYIFCDLIGLYFLLKITDCENKKTAFFLWLFNPIIIFTSYMFGQIDIIPTLFVIIALYFAQKSITSRNDYIYNINIYALISLLSLGIGGCFKNYPLLLIPIFAIVLGNRDVKKILLLIVASIVPYTIILIPYMHSISFFLLGGGSLNILNMLIDVSITKISVFILIYLLILIYLFYIESTFSFDTIWIYCFASLTALFVTSLWLPQWYVWIIPFLILSIIKVKELIGFYLVIITFYFTYILWWGNSLLAGLFSPINPVFKEFIGLNNIISSVYPFEKLLSIFYTLFVAISVVIVYFTYARVIQKKACVPIITHKSLFNYQFIFAIPILIMITVMTFGIIMGGSSIMDVQVTNSDGTIVGEIYGNYTVGQTFYSNFDNLNAIDISFGTWTNRAKNNIIFHLRELNSSEDLVNMTINAKSIHDNEYYRIKFPPLKNSKDKEYYFFIESPDSSPGNAVTIWQNKTNQYNQGTEYINGWPSDGDLLFKTYRQVNSLEVFIDKGGSRK